MAELTSIFDVFNGLPAADAADAHDWVTKNCDELGVPNYEDAHVDIIRFWLRALTGINWHRAFEHGARDNVDENFTEKDGQFGTVHFMRMEEGDQLPSIENKRAPSGDFCQVSSVPTTYIYRLEVYRDAGGATAWQENSVIQAPIGSAVDVFKRVMTRLQLPIFQEALRQYCIEYFDQPLRLLPNIPVEVNSRYERRAIADLTVDTVITGSIRVPGADDIEVEFCDELGAQPLIINDETKDLISGSC